MLFCVFPVDVPTPAPQEIPDAEPREKPFCSNGLPGMESEDGAVCCWHGCNECVGRGEETCIGVTDCCEQTIIDEGLMCSEAEEGPCIIDTGAVTFGAAWRARLFCSVY